MADDYVASAGTADGDRFAADDDGVRKHPYVKVEFGANDTQTPVDASNPLPVVQTGALPAGNNNIGDVDVASSALPTGASTAARQDTGNTALAAIQAAVEAPPLPTGAATSAKQDAHATLTGAVDEAAPATDTASSGLNGRLQRIAQRITALIALVPATLSNGNFRVSLQEVGSVTVPVSMATNTPVGNVAHGSADSGAPIKIGGRADTTFQTAEADGDRVDALFDVYGLQRVRGDHPNAWSYHDDDVSAVTTDGTVQSAPGAGLSVYITSITISIGAATASSIFLEESTTKILGPWYLEAIAGRTVHITFPQPHKCTANTAILVTNTGSVTFSIDIKGFIAP